MSRTLKLAVAVLLGAAGLARAQTPLGSAFTYQGRLTDGGSPAEGNFDFQFLLFDAPVGGSQAGPTLDRPGVAVNTGLFTVSLDFGSAASGVDARFLETRVRPAGSAAYTTLTGRQRLTPAPNALYAVTSQHATSATTGVAAGPGLTGGGTSGDLTLAADFSLSGRTNGTSSSVARADHTHFGQAWSGSGIGLELTRAPRAASPVPRARRTRLVCWGRAARLRAGASRG